MGVTNKSMLGIVDGSRLDKIANVLNDEEPLFIEVSNLIDDEEQSVGEAIWVSWQGADNSLIWPDVWWDNEVSKYLEV